MPEKKLPKGVRTLQEIATKGGKGEVYLREYRRSRREPGMRGFRSVAEQHSDIGEKIRRSLKYRKKFGEIERMLKRPPMAAKPTPRLSDIDLFAISGVRAADKRRQAEILAQKAGKLGGRLGLLSLPFLYLDFRDTMKQPKLHEIEREASARRM